MKKKRAKFWRPKGRILEAVAVAQVAELLEGFLPKRNLLIEYLHLIQDRYAALSHAHLHALADWMKISTVEVFEVASFYHHFDCIGDDVKPRPPLTLRVCDSISCELSGSSALLKSLGKNINPTNIRIQRVPCVGRCDKAPVAILGQNPIAEATLEKVEQAIENEDIQCPKLPSTFADYLQQGGYKSYQNCQQDNPDSVIKVLEDAGLRGLGGAGFSAGKKWRILREQQSPRWVAVNVDEGEPGTFKDRLVLENQPHALLEGMLIAAWAIDSEQCIIYVRDEYPGIRAALLLAIKELSKWANFKLPNIQVRRGAGAYICGEESAMLESIEGKRGLPRQRPPYIAQEGLFGHPTLEHNAETLMWIPLLLQNGANWFYQEGRNERHGLRRYSLSGQVKTPGVYLAPAGISVQELIDEYGGGMKTGHTLYGYLPGGASGGILPANLADLPLDFDTLQPYGCFIGSAAVIVFSEHDKARDIALNAMQFFAHESCGQCTPCRVGTVQAVEMMNEKVWPIQALEELACVMEDASICGLGQAAPNPVRCVIKYFSHEVVGE